MRQRAHNLSAEWAAAECAAASGVDPARGLVDRTKCKKKGPNGRTAQLRIVEYHASKLRRNNAAHELREHEEVELLYMLHGRVIVTLRQGHPHERVLYRRLLRPGDVAYYPGWQSHSLLAVEDDHATYLATRYLGRWGVPKGAAEPPRFWSIEGRDATPVTMHDSASVWTDASVTRGTASLGVRRTDDPAGGRIADANGSDLLLLLTSGAARVGDAHLLAPATLLLPAGSWSQGDAIAAADATATMLQFELSRPERDSSAGAPDRVMRAPVASAAAAPAAAPSAEQEADRVVHLCVVAMGKLSVVAETELMLRSARAASTAAIALHLVVSPSTQTAAEELIESHRTAWHSAETTRVDEEQIEAHVSRAVPGFNTSLHHTGRAARVSNPHGATTLCLRPSLCSNLAPSAFGAAKTFLHRFLPSVSKCLYIDTDMLVMEDIAALWAQFADFGPKTIMQMQLTDKENDAKDLSLGLQVLPKVFDPSHMCSCISLMHLERMRGAWEPLLSAGWALLPQRYRGNRGNRGGFRASNQGLIHLAIRAAQSPWSPAGSAADTQPPFKHLALGWNLDMCTAFHGCTFLNASWDCSAEGTKRSSAAREGGAQLFAGAMHGNCPNKITGSLLKPSKVPFRADVVEDAFLRSNPALRQHAAWRGFGRYIDQIERTSWSVLKGVQHHGGVHGGCALRGHVQC